jgi:predicted DNA-binding transcriptional regulator AlpA
MSDPNQRLIKILKATPKQQALIDGILAGKDLNDKPKGEPLLLGMTAAARYLGVSRTSLWRMARAGIFKRIEILPGSTRFRRKDLEAFVEKGGCHADK